MDRDTGRKKKRNRKGGVTTGMAALVWLLCGGCAAAVAYGGPGTAGLTALTAFADVYDPTADTSTGTEEVLVDITGEDQLKQWCDQRLMGGDSIAVLPESLVVTKPLTLRLPDGQTSTSPIEIRTPEGPIKILTPKNLTQTGVVIDNPNLLITRTEGLISIEGEGYLTLKRGQIQRDASDEPVIILRSQGVLVWEEGEDFMGLKETDIRDGRIGPPEPVPPGENQTPEYGGTQPQLTETVLLNLGADGSGSVRLEFKNLPSDTNALYMLHSESGRSWKKEKSRVTAASSQSGQETVKYEDFLKEIGDMLNTSIVEDGYLIYRFQSGDSFLYVKVSIEWSGGGYETDKIKIAIPETVGQGLTSSYGGSHSYAGGYTGSYGSSPGGHGGGVTSGGNSSAQPGTQEESNVPETPMRDRGGRGWESYTPYSAPGYKDGGAAAGQTTEEILKEAMPSQVRGQGEKNRDGNPQIQPANEVEDTVRLPEGENEVADTEREPSREEIQDGEDSGKSGSKWYAGAVLAAAVVGGAAVCFRRRRRK